MGGAPSVRAVFGAHWRVLPLIVVVAVVSNVLFAVFVASEHTLYGADHVAYWSMSAAVADGLANRPLATLAEIVSSVATRELNLLPALPTAVFMLVFGSSRTAYVLAVLNLYALPALFLAAVLVDRILRRAAEPPRPLVVLWACVVATLFLPAYWWPISLGYLGVGGVLLCFAALLVYFSPADEPHSRWRLVGLGAALALVFLFRRWYAFWSVAFIITMGADAALRLWLHRPLDRRRAWSIVREPLGVAASAAVALTAAAGPMLWHVLRSDYGDLFAFYKVHHSLAAELGGAVRQLGGVGVGLLLVMAAILALARASRRPALVLMLLLALSAVLFRRVQDPSPQHWYLLFPSMLPIVAGGVVWIIQRCRSNSARLAIGVGASVLALGNLAAVCLLPPGSLAPLVSALRFEPQQRPDLAEVTRLLGFLDRLEAQRPGMVYVIGSSPTLNNTALACANLSLSTAFRSPWAMLQTSHVDRRDGFPAGLLEARYVVVSDPVQCRQPPLGQWVVELPARQMLGGRGVGAAFGRLPQSFPFERGVEVYVYERLRPSTADEIAALSRELAARYPDRPEIWAPPS